MVLVQHHGWRQPARACSSRHAPAPTYTHPKKSVWCLAEVAVVWLCGSLTGRSIDGHPYSLWSPPCRLQPCHTLQGPLRPGPNTLPHEGASTLTTNDSACGVSGTNDLSFSQPRPFVEQVSLISTAAKHLGEPARLQAPAQQLNLRLCLMQALGEVDHQLRRCLLRACLHSGTQRALLFGVDILAALQGSGSSAEWERLHTRYLPLLRLLLSGSI